MTLKKYTFDIQSDIPNIVWLKKQKGQDFPKSQGDRPVLLRCIYAFKLLSLYWRGV